MNQSITVNKQVVELSIKTHLNGTISVSLDARELTRHQCYQQDAHLCERHLQSTRPEAGVQVRE